MNLGRAAVISFCTVFRETLGRSFDSVSVADDVLAHRKLAPEWVNGGVTLLTILFEWSSILWGGRRFSQMTPINQLAHIRRWKNAPFGVCRNTIRFYESLITLAVFSADNPPLRAQ